MIIGDFNSTFTLRNVPPNDDDIAYGTDRSRLPYCVMTASGVLANAADTVAGLTGPAPRWSATLSIMSTRRLTS